MVNAGSEAIRSTSGVVEQAGWGLDNSFEAIEPRKRVYSLQAARERTDVFRGSGRWGI